MRSESRRCAAAVAAAAAGGGVVAASASASASLSLSLPRFSLSCSRLLACSPQRVFSLPFVPFLSAQVSGLSLSGFSEARAQLLPKGSHFCAADAVLTVAARSRSAA